MEQAEGGGGEEEEEGVQATMNGGTLGSSSDAVHHQVGVTQAQEGSDTDDGEVKMDPTQAKEAGERGENCEGASNMAPASVDTDDISQQHPSETEPPSTPCRQTTTTTTTPPRAAVTPNDESSTTQQQQQQQQQQQRPTKRLRIQLVEGYCRKRCTDGSCWCFKARGAQHCQACHKRVLPGHCIENKGYGWVHVRCNVDENRRRNLFQDFQVCDALIPNNNNRSITSDDGREHQRLLTHTVEPAAAAGEQPQHAFPHGDNIIVASPADNDDQDDDDDDSFESRLTDEQKEIVNYEARPGDVIRVNALAGSGKTTTIAFLTHKLVSRRLGQSSSAKLLYIVFSKSAQEEARVSGKFPKSVEILTSHAFAKRRLFGRGNSVVPCNGYKRENVVTKLKLDEYVKQHFPALSPKKQKRIAKAISGFVIQTVTRFQHSDDQHPSSDHVPFKAKYSAAGTGKRSEWKKMVSAADYVLWATELFRDYILRACIEQTNDAISHDSYLKVLQLLLRQREDNATHTSPFHSLLDQLYVNSWEFMYDVVLIDEAQDLTPCQADLLWGNSLMACPGRTTTYLVGDENQRIYQFRGAGDTFEKTVANKSFPLHGSFRFGKNVADVANTVLSRCSTKKLRGLAVDDGEVTAGNSIERGVVICRSRNGMYRYLEKNTPTKWAFYDTRQKLLKMTPELRELEAFVAAQTAKKEAQEQENEGQQNEVAVDDSEESDDDAVAHVEVFRHKGENFEHLEDLLEYCQEIGDSETSNNIFLIIKFRERNPGKSVGDLFAVIKDSWVPDWRKSVNDLNNGGQTDNVDLFDGVVFVTAHKSKGLEFDNVFINNDFQFSALLAKDKHAVLSSQFWKEQLNFIYVAMTRAKKKLFLCDEADGFVKHIRRDVLGDTSEDDDFWPLPSLEECRTHRQQLDDAWQAFSIGTDPVAALEDIPWPSGPPNNLFWLHSSMPVEEQRLQIRAALLRYHPDKFMSKYVARLQNGIVDAVKERLEDVTRQAREWWSLLPQWSLLPHATLDLGSSSQKTVKMGPQAKHWHFTLNNYDAADEQRLVALGGQLSVEYLVFGREVADSGTRHLQGYIVLSQRKRLSWLRNHVSPRAYYSIARNPGIQSADYCKKEGDFVEIGVCPDVTQGRRSDLVVARE